MWKVIFVSDVFLLVNFLMCQKINVPMNILNLHFLMNYAISISPNVNFTTETLSIKIPKQLIILKKDLFILCESKELAKDMLLIAIYSRLLDQLLLGLEWP